MGRCAPCWRLDHPLPLCQSYMAATIAKRGLEHSTWLLPIFASPPHVNINFPSSRLNRKLRRFHFDFESWMWTVAVGELCTGIGEGAQLREGAILTEGRSVAGIPVFVRQDQQLLPAISNCNSLPSSSSFQSRSVNVHFPQAPEFLDIEIAVARSNRR